ncbi:MAG: hypothetical protein Q9181_003133 [Wetmoreana brouardii]
MPPLKASRCKKQTRLRFTPPPSSSPAASDLPEQTQLRAAAVRYAAMESPTKKRRLAPANPGQKIPQLDLTIPSSTSHRNRTHDMALPTPAPSSQVEVQQEEVILGEPLTSSSSSDGEDDIVTPRRTARRPLRLQQDQSQESSSSPRASVDDDGTDKRGSVEQRGAEPSHSLSKISSAEESDAPSRRTTVSGKQKIHAQPQNLSSATPVTVSSDEDSDPISYGPSGRGSKQQQESPRTPQSSRRRPFSSSRQSLRSISGGTSGAALLERLQKTPVGTPTRSSKRAGSMNQRRSGSSNRLPSRRSRHQSETESDDSGDSLMDELRKSVRKPALNPEMSLDNSVASSDADIRSSRRRKKLARKDTSPSVGESEKSEPEVDDYRKKERQQSRADPTGRLRSKHPTAEKSARQKQLELLRKRRAGKEADPSTEDDLEIVTGGGDIHADAGGLSEQDTGSSIERLEHSKTLNLDEYEQDFVDDEDATIGAPVGLDEMPLEFTGHAHKKPFEHFKDVVEWMVHNKLNPAFARNDEVYKIAVRKLDDEAQAYAGSKFMSSVWKAEFTKALKKYPELASTFVPTMFDQKCEACGRSRHPAKHRLVFSGKPYYRESLEEISTDEDDSGEDQQTAGLQKQFFFLGTWVSLWKYDFGVLERRLTLLRRVCNANAETAHALQHWRHAINQSVMDLLRAKGHLSPAKIVERENLSVNKRKKYVERIIDEMETDGFMRTRFLEFKQNLAAARDAKNEVSHYRG